MKLFFFLFTALFAITIISCSESTEPEPLFKYTKRFESNFSIDTTLNNIVVKNAIGYIFLYGVSNQTNLKCILDKTVWVESSDKADQEMNKITFNKSNSADSNMISLNFPATPLNGYYCTMNLDIPNGKNVYIRNPNDGVQTSYLINDLYAETKNSDCVINDHNGSLEVHTNQGNIISNLGIPDSGFCKCYSVDGDITIRIPIGSTGNIHLKSTAGNVSYHNLNITTTTNTGKEIVGTLGSGNEVIYLESTNGDVKLIGF